MGALNVLASARGSGIEKVIHTSTCEVYGTAGGLGLIKGELKDTLLVVNGDTLTTLNFSEPINYHRRNGAITTIALKKREV